MSRFFVLSGLHSNQHKLYGISWNQSEKETSSCTPSISQTTLSPTSRFGKTGQVLFANRLNPVFFRNYTTTPIPSVNRPSHTVRKKSSPGYAEIIMRADIWEWMRRFSSNRFLISVVMPCNPRNMTENNVWRLVEFEHVFMQPVVQECNHVNTCRYSTE